MIGSHTINGYPMLGRYYMVYKQDCELIRERVTKLEVAAKEILE
jgi:hypothetical protein